MTKFLLLFCSAVLTLYFKVQTSPSDKNTYDIYALKFGERNNYVQMENEAIIKEWIEFNIKSKNG